MKRSLLPTLVLVLLAVCCFSASAHVPHNTLGVSADIYNKMPVEKAKPIFQGPKVGTYKVPQQNNTYYYFTFRVYKYDQTYCSSFAQDHIVLLNQAAENAYRSHIPAKEESHLLTAIGGAQIIVHDQPDETLTSKPDGTTASCRVDHALDQVLVGKSPEYSPLKFALPFPSSGDLSYVKGKGVIECIVFLRPFKASGARIKTRK